MAAVMTPVNNNVGRKSLGQARGGNIPLFTSPRTRKSTGGQLGLRLTPGNRESLADSDQQASLLNNDEEELRERQRQRAAELQQQNMASPSTPADRRKSMGPATGMTNAAIVEHYSNCIKLSAENKINMKNAFNLQLIDCMSEMLRKKDPEMNNFQAASCTLDASTKIYAYRVDCVHNDTLKMAGGLGRTGEAQEEEGAAGANPDDEDPENASKAKKKSKRKPKKTIENNVDSLNLSKFDLEYEVDPLFKKNCSMFDEGRNGGVNFLTSLMLKDDDCQLVLDTDSMSNSKADDAKETQHQATCFIPILHGLDTTDICPTLKDFNFTNWDPEDEDLMGGPKTPTKRKLDDVMNNLPLANDDHAFDMDAVPDFGAADDSDDEIHQGMDDVEEEVEMGMDRRRGMGHDEQPILAGPGRRELNVVELKDQLSAMPLEYSYFGPTARSAWAGPLHWMIPRGPKHGIEQQKQADPNKKKRRKNALVLDFESIPEFGNEFAPARGVSKLTHGTLLQWLTEKITLPEDLHFDIKEFTQSFTRPLLAVRPVGNREDPVATQNVEGMPYDYENRRDAENFCPVLEDDGGDHHNHSDGDDDAGGTMMTFDDPTADFGSQADATKVFSSQFTGDNLIAAPNMVAKIQINYARVAKKMDMRRLKSTMWNMINHRKEDATPENPKAFSQVYHQIPGLLPEKMAENLSVALAFAALLHLVNENNLQLQQTYSHLDDFIVVHPK